MVVYDLICSAGHRFEGWFDSPVEYERQHTTNEIACPQCGCGKIQKLPTAARLVGNASASADDSKRASQSALERLHEIVERHYEDVGHNFPDEARKIYYGETEERRIRGTATATEAKELVEEGIAVLPLPPATPDKRGLN